MTKYVLNSGGMRDKPELSGDFFAEVVKDLGSTPLILSCFFARQREYWEEKYAQDVAGLPALIPEGVTPTFELAFPASFAEQVERADAIYIHGGDDHLLLYWLKQFDLTTLFKDKVVATNSAGSNALATHFWTCDWRMNMDGLSILPIKFLAHYRSDFAADDPRGPVNWTQALEELTAYGDTTLPIHALEEARWVVVEG